MSAEVEETLKRIQSHRGVEGIIIVNKDGITLKSTMDEAKTSEYAANVSQLAAKARSIVRTLDADDDLSFLRIRSRKHELMVAPDAEYMLIVVQNPNVEAGKE